MINNSKKFITNYIQIQLLITLISLPILINFGIPISTMSVIGNLLFMPFITTFLFISSIKFFTEILSIPNDYITTLLNKVTDILEQTLKFGQKEWLIGFAKINKVILIIIPIITALIIIYKKSIYERILYLSVFLFTITIIFYYQKEIVKKEYIPLTNNKLLIENNNNEISLTDYGLLNMKGNPENYIRFQLKSYLIQKYGLLSINNLIITRPGIRSFKGAKAICSEIKVDTVFIKCNKTKLSKYTWKCYFEMKKILEKNNTKIIRN